MPCVCVNEGKRIISIFRPNWLQLMTWLLDTVKLWWACLYVFRMEWILMLTDLLNPLTQTSRRFCCFIQRHSLNSISAANNSWGCLATGLAKNLLKTYTFYTSEDTSINNLIFMFSDKKVSGFFKGNVDIFGSVDKDSFGGPYMKRELWLGLQYLVVYLAVPVSTCPAW